jgi:hypothetical protein
MNQLKVINGCGTVLTYSPEGRETRTREERAVRCRQGELCHKCQDLVIFAYEVEGDTYLGNLKAYADAWRNAHYAGLSLSDTVALVWHEDGAWSMQVHHVKTESTPYDEDQWGYTYLRVLGCETSVKVDGRV